MIVLTKLQPDHIIAMFDACFMYHEVLKVLAETLPDENHKINNSIIETLGQDLFDKKAKIYKQQTFKISLKLHDAILLVKALSYFCKNTENDFSKSIAQSLIMEIHPQTV